MADLFLIFKGGFILLIIAMLLDLVITIAVGR